MYTDGGPAGAGAGTGIRLRDRQDDEQLMADLSEAMRARQAVPSWCVLTGRLASAWRDIDAELARLTYDSRAGTGTVAVMRSQHAWLRALSFTSARLNIELEIAGDVLVGQVVPPRSGTLETHTKAGLTISPVDEIGCFVVEPVPAGPFRLRFRLADGIDVMTGWITP